MPLPLFSFHYLPRPLVLLFTAFARQLDNNFVCPGQIPGLPITVPPVWCGGMSWIPRVRERGRESSRKRRSVRAEKGNCLYDFHFITRKRIEMNFYCATTKRADNISPSCCCFSLLLLLLLLLAADQQILSFV